MAKVHTSRNKDLVPGIGRFSRSAIYRKRALYKRKKTGVKKDLREEPKTRLKEIGGDKNGGKRIVPMKREVSQLLYSGSNILTSQRKWWMACLLKCIYTPHRYCSFGCSKLLLNHVWMISVCNKALKCLMNSWNKGYGNDVGNGRANIESMHLFVNIGLNRLLGGKDQELNAWNKYFFEWVGLTWSWFFVGPLEVFPSRSQDLLGAFAHHFLGVAFTNWRHHFVLFLFLFFCLVAGWHN